MKPIQIPSAFYLFALLLFGACASQSIIQGGPRDERPPELVVQKSSPNFQTSFQAKKIEFYFDEYVKIHEPNANLLVTPPLVYNPRLESKGKKVVLQFNEKEVFRENTTYILQFGNAIQDITENNPATDLFFVFSTGTELDSLVLHGQIFHYEDLKPAEGVLALIYDEAADSAVYNNRPVYFAKSGADGSFRIPYMASGTYYMSALRDENGNYRFDQSKEAVGFYEEAIKLSVDSLELEPIFIFTEIGNPIIQDVDSTSKGVLKIRYDKDISQSEITMSAPGVRSEMRLEPNNLTIFHEADSLTRHVLVIRHEAGRIDSIKLSSYPLGEKMSDGKPTAAAAIGTFRSSEHPDSNLVIQFTPPIRFLDPGKWTCLVKADSSVIPLDLVLNLPNFWNSEVQLKPLRPGSYQLLIAKGGITDFYGVVNQTEISIPIQVPDYNQFVELVLELDSLDAKQHYVFTLQQKSRRISTWRSHGVETDKLSFKNLQVGEYTLEVIFDTNGNGRWDSGKYLQRRYPERKKSFPLEALRPDWDSRQKIAIGGDLKLSSVDLKKEAPDLIDDNPDKQ